MLTGFAEAPQQIFQASTEMDRLVDLFGGSEALKHRVATPLDAHEMILEGIPGRAFENLVDGLSVISPSEAFESAIGMSLRTFQRYKANTMRVLSPEQGSRAWNFASALARATVVFGSQAEAEGWMLRPAMGLNERRPIDLLATTAGTELVQTYLDRMDYGVYA